MLVDGTSCVNSDVYKTHIRSVSAKFHKKFPEEPQVPLETEDVNRTGKIQGPDRTEVKPDPKPEFHPEREFLSQNRAESLPVSDTEGQLLLKICCDIFRHVLNLLVHHVPRHRVGRARRNRVHVARRIGIAGWQSVLPRWRRQKYSWWGQDKAGWSKNPSGNPWRWKRETCWRWKRNSRLCTNPAVYTQNTEDNQCPRPRR